MADLETFATGQLVRLTFGTHSAWCKRIGAPASVLGVVVESTASKLKLDSPTNPGPRARYGMTETCWGEVWPLRGDWGPHKQGTPIASIQHTPAYQAAVVAIEVA